MSDRSEWTILYYASGAGGLSSSIQDNLEGLARVGSGDKVNLVCQFTSASDSAVRFRVMLGSRDHEVDVGDVIPGTVEALLDFIQWAALQFPARRYGLILLGHGTGWRPEDFPESTGFNLTDALRLEEDVTGPLAGRPPVLFRPTAGKLIDEFRKTAGVLTSDISGHSLDSNELTKLTEHFEKILGTRLEFMGFDACLMGALEIAGCLMDNVRYLVASEQLEPSSGWPAEKIATLFRKLAGAATEDILRTVPELYPNHYSFDPPNGLTLSVTNLGKFSAVMDSISRLSGVMLSVSDIEALRDVMTLARSKSLTFPADLRDARFFFSKLFEKASAFPDVRDAIPGVHKSIQEAILSFSSRGNIVTPATGLSLYVTRDGTGVGTSPYYKNTLFGSRTKWADVLEKLWPPVQSRS